MAIPVPAPTIANGAADSDNEAISSSDASDHAAQPLPGAEVSSMPAAKPDACRDTSFNPENDRQQAPDPAGPHSEAQLSDGESKADKLQLRDGDTMAEKLQLDDDEFKAGKLQKGLASAAEAVTSEPPQTDAPQPVPSIAEASLTAQLQVKAAQADMSEPERLANDWIQLHLMPTINRQVHILAAAITATQSGVVDLAPHLIMSSSAGHVREVHQS